jgi:DNA-binding CsgD family transcriptional regulator
MAAAEVARIEDLVRALLDLRPASDLDEEVRQDPQSEEIIFDLIVDGARYLVLRLPKPPQVSVQLTPREREIVRLVALGHSNKIIADVLNISSWTVCTHMRRIFAKLGVGSRAAVVAHMAEIGRAGAAERIERKRDLREGDTPTRDSTSPVKCAASLLARR